MRKNPYKHTIVIPTCGSLDILKQHFPRYIEYCGKDVLIIVSINAKSEKEALQAKVLCEKTQELLSVDTDDVPSLDFVVKNKMSGFAKAVNDGCKKMEQDYGVSDFVTIANDDLLVTKDWLFYLERCLKAQKLRTRTQVAKQEPPYSANGRLGMVGPVSYGVFNEQTDASNMELVKQIGLDTYAELYSKKFERKYQLVTFLSGFCLTLSKGCFNDLKYKNGNLYDETFKVGGFEDDDLSHRAFNQGWYQAICRDCYVGHSLSQTLQTIPNTFHGLTNSITFLRKYESETQCPKKVIAAYRIAIKVVNDVAQFKSSIARSAQLLDGFSVVITNNPFECLESYDRNLFNQLTENDRKWILECKDADSKTIAEKTKDWIDSIVNRVTTKKEGDQIVAFSPNLPINVEHWDKEFNERDERNRSHELAHELNADWIMSIDSDEVIEDRITKELIYRWTSHPNTLRKVGSVGFLNHWETMELLRLDPPFDVMAGPRLWKVCKSAKYEIKAGTDIGLHCGNSPEYGALASFSTGLRMRHLSHVRSIDRFAKFKFYTQIDDEKDPHYVGSDNYSHIVRSERIPVSIYNPNNGICMFMLSYKEEEVSGIYRWLDSTYGLCDRQAIVWTGEWSEEDKENYLFSKNKNLTEEEWNNTYKTGPSWKLAELCRLYKVDLLHKKLTKEEGLSGCRNHAIEHFRSTNSTGSLGWCFFVDPDEQGDLSVITESIKTMAQSVDVWAYLFKFDNPLNTQDKRGRIPNSMSESVRMFRLDKTGIMKMNGLVHESFSDALNTLRANGIPPKVLYAPFRMENKGLQKSPEDMAIKLKKYKDLLVETLNKDPYNSGAWLSLGLQYINDEMPSQAKQCIYHACDCAEDAYLPFKEMSTLLLKEAIAFIYQARMRTNSGHQYYHDSGKMLEILQQFVPPEVRIDTCGVTISDVELPQYIPMDQRNDFLQDETEV